MKIIYHHRTRADGAEGVHIRQMCVAFKELGHQVQICGPKVSRTNGLAAGMRGISKQGSRGITGFLKLATRQLAEIAYNMVSVTRLVHAIWRFAPDIIYERFSSYHIAGVVAATLFKTKLVLEVNATDTGRFAHSPLAYKRIARIMENFCLRKASVIAVVSSPLKECVMDRGVPPDRIVVTPNAINPCEIEELNSTETRSLIRGQLGLDDKIVIGFVGSMRAWHGIDILADAIPTVLADVPNAVFLVVGTGELEHKIIDLKKDERIRNRVIVTGGVSHRDALSFISVMDIGLMPHSNAWGSPMKILEYMALGAVSIAPELPPILDIIEDGKNGILFKPNNLEDLTAKILRIAQDSDYRRKISRQAMHCVTQKHQWVTNAKRVLDLNL